MWTIAWPLYRWSRPATDGDRVVGDGEDDELHLVEEGRGLGERADARDEGAEALAPARRRGSRRPGSASRPG